MVLHEADVAGLAGQAVGLLDADVHTVIEPVDPVDPYRRGSTSWTLWPMFDKHRTLGIRIQASWSPAEALARMISALSAHVTETRRFWAHTFPICPGHTHTSDITVEDGDVVLRCPDTGAEVGRVHPDAGP